MKKQALGRGLSALIDTDIKPDGGSSINEIEISKDGHSEVIRTGWSSLYREHDEKDISRSYLLVSKEVEDDFIYG
jgi:hypothetical protein